MSERASVGGAERLQVDEAAGRQVFQGEPAIVVEGQAERYLGAKPEAAPLACHTAYDAADEVFGPRLKRQQLRVAGGVIHCDSAAADVCKAQVELIDDRRDIVRHAGLEAATLRDDDGDQAEYHESHKREHRTFGERLVVQGVAHVRRTPQE